MQAHARLIGQADAADDVAVADRFEPCEEVRVERPAHALSLGVVGDIDADLAGDVVRGARVPAFAPRGADDLLPARPVPLGDCIGDAEPVGMGLLQSLRQSWR